MAGVGGVVIATSGGITHDNSAELVDYFGTSNLIRQAVASHVDLVIFISTIGATHPEHRLNVEPSSVGWKAQAEELIRRSGVPYCIVRSGWLKDVAGGMPISVSQGDTADGWISRADLAETCTRLLLLPAALGKTIDIVAAHDRPAIDLGAAIEAAHPDTAAPARGRTSASLASAV
jgi:uncharacterized protein YbjT (DUF2867 family)